MEQNLECLNGTSFWYHTHHMLLEKFGIRIGHIFVSDVEYE